MKQVFYITSSICIDNTIAFDYGYKTPRSAFSDLERFRQTIYTITSINLVAPNSVIYLVDNSENIEQFYNILQQFHNLHIVEVNTLDPVLAAKSRTTNSKGYGEALLTNFFLKNYLSTLNNFDFIFKVSGRYFFTRFDNYILNDAFKDNFIIDTINWNWQPSWGYPDWFNKNNNLFWANTTGYGLGNLRLKEFMERSTSLVEFYEKHNEFNYVDYESVFYYYILDGGNIVNKNFNLSGWNGSKGNFVSF